MSGIIEESESIMLFALIAFLVLMYLVALRDRSKTTRRVGALTKALEEAQRRLRSSVSDTRSMLNQEASIVLVFDRHSLDLLFANQQALDLFGCDSTEALSDQIMMRPDAWQPEPFSLMDFERWMNQLKTSGSQRKDWLFSGPDRHGVWTDCFVGNTVFEGKAARMLSAGNIHQYRMDRLADSMRNRVLTDITAGNGLEGIFDSLCKLTEIRLNDTRCQISLFDQQRDHLIPMGTSRFAKELRTHLPVIPASYGATSIGTAAYTRNRIICESIQNDHRWQGDATLAEALGVNSVWSEPILNHHGELLGVFSAFSSVPGKSDDGALADVASVVSLAGLAIERQGWRQNLEAAASSERFIRQLGVDLVNLPPGPEFKTRLRSVLHNVVAQYELGSVGVWEQSEEHEGFSLLAATSRAVGASSGADEDEPVGGTFLVEERLVRDAFRGSQPEYFNAQDDLYTSLVLNDEGKPVLVIPVDDIEQGGRRLGLIAVQSQFVFIAQEVIEHLQVIATMVRTVLLNRRLVQSLSRAMETEQSERRKLEGELSVARSIQMSMVPGAGQFKETYRNWTIDAWLKPAKAVGGDLYEFIRLPTGKAVVAVGDVSDKGAPAALFMAKTVSLLNLLVRMHDGDLKAVAEALNGELCRANDSCMFVTMILCTIDLTTGRVSWLNAGHDAPLSIKGIAAPEFLHVESGPPLGLYENACYPVSKTRIVPGQKVALYSDGVTEAFNANREAFGSDRLLSLGFRVPTQSEGLLELLREQMLGFIGQAPQSDDITILTIHHHGVGS